MQEKINNKIRVKRVANRGHYDQVTIHSILDKEFVCQVSFVYDGYPIIIPTLYGRDGNTLYLHGSVKSRMMKSLREGGPVCISVTRVNGYVLARSVFHHSANYESVVLFGTAREVVNESDKLHAMEVVTEQVLKGRWQEARQPNPKEIDVTMIVAFDIEEGSAKIRTGGPKDDKEDYALDIWAGVVPIEKTYLPPIADPDRLKDEAIPDSVKQLFGKTIH